MAHTFLSWEEIDQEINIANKVAGENGHNLSLWVCSDDIFVGTCANCHQRVSIPRVISEFDRKCFGVPLFSKCGNAALGSQILNLPWLQPA